VARVQADRILTVSESARRDLLRVFGLPPARVHVVSEGSGSVFRPRGDEAILGDARARYGLPAEGPLLLHVGGLSPHKNLQGLVRALGLIQDRAWHLALVGDPQADGFHSGAATLKEEIAAAGLEGRVTLTGFVPDGDLALLYNASTMLVFPSLAEGFGLPALEAMACGLPVAASGRGALPEVLGDAGAFFDPQDPHAIAETVSGLLADPRARQRMREKGLARAQAFTWAAAARRTLDLLLETARA
jgi:glycosyltransferase involved in cell wall biosynthesis